MDAKSIGKKIYELRKENGFTQRELADKVNVTNKAVSKWENGVNFPDPGLMDSLAEALGVTVSELVEAKTEPVKVNKPLLYTAIIIGLIPVAAAFLLAGLEVELSESGNWIGYAMFIAQVVAFVVLIVNYMINEKFLWTSKDGRTYLQILHFAVVMSLFIGGSYTFVSGTEYAGVVMSIIMFTIVAMQEMTYTKKSKGLISRLGMFLVMCLAFVFLVCRMHPVMW